MPSKTHECVVELLQKAPALATTLLEMVANIKMPAGEVIEGNVALGDAIPKSLYADHVVQVRGTKRRNLAAIVTEVQTQKKATKRYSWMGYTVSVWAKLRCPTYLLVITFDPKIAAWCRKPIPVGQPGLELIPIVIDYSVLGAKVTAEDFAALPELVVLWALIHSRSSQAVETATFAQRL